MKWKKGEAHKLNERILEMQDLLVNSSDYVVLDIETTGFSPAKGARIIEIGAVKVINDKVVHTFQELINPEIKISKKITEVTGITNEMVQNKPIYGQVLPIFHEWIEDLPVFIHNAEFDWNRFLIPFFQKVGISPLNPIACTRVLSGHYLTELRSHSLNTLCKHYKIINEEEHRALSDAIATQKIIEILKSKTKNLVSESFLGSNNVLQQTLWDDSTQETEQLQHRKSFKIRRVSYWEKKISKSRNHQRVYVTTTEGSAYIDIKTGVWYSKDMKGNVDFKDMEERVIRFLGVKNKEGLLLFKGSKQYAG